MALGAVGGGNTTDTMKVYVQRSKGKCCAAMMMAMVMIKRMA